MPDNKTNTLMLMLMGIVILLMIAITGLFLRMTQLQQVVLASLGPLHAESVGATYIPIGLDLGTVAPEFSLSNGEGREVSLNDFAGKPLMLMFSATQCPACQQLYPILKDFNVYTSDVQLVMISQGSIEENQELIKQYTFNFPVLNWEIPIAQSYQVPGTPFFYVIDAKGQIVGKGFANSLNDLEQLLANSGL